ncbi:RHS domain-containing protein [Pseudomonas eucalypticola]|uniref:RHS domain-containing protein n=1 Tax=Pseudomonas eucalypticola TaxID=2599595 RepID=A0A7D5H2U9_9PSED|nr:RHS domain-containing protein [Pseudomonas eucalypticola]
MGRKAWQYASSVPAEKLSKVTNPNVPTRVLLNDYRNAVQRQYEYDPAGELTRTLDQLRGEIRYEYEANGQLHGRETGKLMTSEEFRYDPAANRLNFGTSQFDKVKDNRLRNWQNNEYRYDPWGNLIEKRSGQRQVQYFKYDCENRLVASETMVQGRLHSKGRYQYDSLGRRVGKSAEQDGQVQGKRFLWQGLRMLQELTPERDSLYLYEPGSYAPLARVDRTEGEAQQLYYYHTDQIGTPLEMTNAEGRIVWQATYKAWGSIETLPVAEVEQNLRFQGQYFDGETGLHYNTFRYHDPEIGRFITQDPIGLDGGFNLYKYAPNPLGWLDPLGWVTYNTMESIAGFQKHHIIPQQLAGHEAIKLAGLNIHDVSNVIYLPTQPENHPTRTIHRGSHPQYTASVEAKLDAIHEHGHSNGWSKAEYDRAVRATIVNERKGLRTGQTMLNKKFNQRGCMWLEFIFCKYRMIILKATGSKASPRMARIRLNSRKDRN